MKEHKIGEIFDYENESGDVVRLECVEETNYCEGCYFYGNEYCLNVRCAEYRRIDRTEIIYRSIK